MTLEGVEFLRRLSQHILNKGFVRIRHFGFLSATIGRYCTSCNTAWG
ncbi:MAG: transposase [Prolixibacteraceae bacterium]|nr:transposase [Prolixibacteraceae bacterium]